VTNTVVYDSGMLISLARRLRVAHVKHEDVTREVRPIVPGPVLAQVWRDSRRLQATLSWYLRTCTIRTEYSEDDYTRVGIMLGRTASGKRSPDLVDALAAYTAARNEPAAIMTSDSADIMACLSTLPRAGVLVVPL
jgi:hypothetical protein